MDIRITIDDSGAARALIRSERALGDLTPIMTAIAGEIDDRVQTAFERKADPVTGTPWPELRPATIRQRIKEGWNATDTLQRTRTLLGGILSTPDSRGVSVRANSVDYALVHQFGSNPIRGIPQRRFAGISPQDAEQFEDILRRHILGR